MGAGRYGGNRNGMGTGGLGPMMERSGRGATRRPSSSSGRFWRRWNVTDSIETAEGAKWTPKTFYRILQAMV